jgi:hypothetical protein
MDAWSHPYCYDHGCLYAGDPSECSIHHQLHQFGAKKVGRPEPEEIERVGFNRSSRQ